MLVAVLAFFMLPPAAAGSQPVSPEQHFVEIFERYVQLQNVAGQTVSIDCQSCLGDVGDRAKSPPGDTVTRALYDCILPAVRELVEKAANVCKPGFDSPLHPAVLHHLVPGVEKRRRSH